MTARIDLHSHSLYSDGELTPEALVILAKHRGLDVLALTDHDTIAGIEAAERQAKLVGLKLIPGTEISVAWLNKELHVLGLGIDPQNTQLQKGLLQQQAARMVRAAKMSEGLSQIGILHALEAAQKIAGGDIVARPHFAQYLVQIGRATDMADAFKRFLTPGKPGFVATTWVEMKTAIEWIKNAGGFAVIAHPARYKLTMTRLRKLITAFKLEGGDGMEVVTSNHSPQEIETMARLCREYELSASMGSDFHSTSGYAQLGVMPPMPSDLNPIWEKCLL